MDTKFIIFEIVFSLTTYFVGYFLGRRMAMKDFFAQAYGAVVESDMDTDEIIAVTYYYSEEAFEERRNETNIEKSTTIIDKCLAVWKISLKF